MTFTNENAPDACRREANFETSNNSNTNQDQVTSQANSMPLLCSGFGQFHTNEPGKKIRKPYTQINLEEIRELVDNPQQVDKSQAQWLIPSTLLSRTFKEQEVKGEFHLLWADIDANPNGIHAIAEIIEDMILGYNFEIYTSKSATEANQKCRILIPSKPLIGSDWVLVQEILNDKLQKKDITPDRASEGAAQLCYLPNRGGFYETNSKRDGKNFDPMNEWADLIQIKCEKETARIAEQERSKSEATLKREAFNSYSGTDDFPSLIDAFNAAYTVQGILLQAGYDQKGDSFRHPNSESGSFSANVKNDRVHSLSSNDPLYTGGEGGGAHDAFSAFTVLFHDGDQDAALKEAGNNWVMIGSESWNTVKQREYAQQNKSATFENDIHLSDEDEQPEKYQEEIFTLEYPPGLVGEIAGYIFQSSRMPIKSFAIAGALTAISHLNKNYSYVSKSDTALNLYQCLIGETGRGKEDPRKAIKRLVDAASNTWAGKDSRIHESIASGAALLRSLEEYRHSLILIDEFGIYLQNALSDKGSTHQKDFIKDLMTLYGLGRSFFAGKSYADKKQNIGRIDKPYINLIGTTTPHELLDGITPKMIDNGFLNRIIFIRADNENPINREPNIQINADLKQKFMELQGYNTSATRLNQLDYENGAHDLLIQLVESLDEKGQFANLWGRTEEQTIRVAGLLAIGDGRVIKREHVIWAWNYVNGSIKAFARKLDKDLAENPFQKQAAKALDLIKDVRNYSSDKQFGSYCQRGLMPRGKLTKLLKMKSKEVEEIIIYLIETRQISHCDVGGVKCFSVL